MYLVLLLQRPTEEPTNPMEITTRSSPPWLYSWAILLCFYDNRPKFSPARSVWTKERVARLGYLRMCSCKTSYPYTPAFDSSSSGYILFRARSEDLTRKLVVAQIRKKPSSHEGMNYPWTSFKKFAENEVSIAASAPRFHEERITRIPKEKSWLCNGAPPLLIPRRETAETTLGNCLDIHNVLTAGETGYLQWAKTLTIVSGSHPGPRIDINVKISAQMQDLLSALQLASMKKNRTVKWTDGAGKPQWPRSIIRNFLSRGFLSSIVSGYRPPFPTPSATQIFRPCAGSPAFVWAGFERYEQKPATGQWTSEMQRGRGGARLQRQRVTWRSFTCLVYGHPQESRQTKATKNLVRSNLVFNNSRAGGRQLESYVRVAGFSPSTRDQEEERRKDPIVASGRSAHEWRQIMEQSHPHQPGPNQLM
ncbi:hypothetical protein B0H11DRAFT_1909685 [Mycena galericulata]|nr:hypothetical protein B0H11DRAFT_1909685 [Mycena galericulata]